jgi:signal transduction histidine kinase/transcriptional regulator with GAF, ATPase, and Fis domain
MKHSSIQENSNPSLLLIIYLTTAIFIIIALPILTSRWVQIPFMGGFLTPNLGFAQTPKFLTNEAWPINNLDLGLHDHLIALEEQDVQNASDVANVLSKYNTGDEITLTISPVTGETYQTDITLMWFSGIMRLLYIYFPLIAAFLCFVAGLWVYSDQRKDTINMAFVVFTTSIAIMLSTYFDFISLHRLIPLFFISIGLAAASLVQIALLLPWHKQSEDKKPWLNYIAYPLNFVLIGLAIFQIQQPSTTAGITIYFWSLLGSLCLSMMFLIYVFLRMRLCITSKFIQKRAQTLLITSIWSFSPVIIYLFINLLRYPKISVAPLILIPLCIYPITYTLNTRRFLIPQTKKSFQRTLIYALITFTFGVIYFILIHLLNIILIKPISPDNPLMIGVMIFLIIFAVQPIRKNIERLLSKPTESSQGCKDLALKYASSLTTTNNKDVAIKLLRDAVRETMHPKHVHIYLYDPEIPGYAVQISDDVEIRNESFIPRDSVIPNTLERLRDVLYFKQKLSKSEKTTSNENLLDTYGSVIFAPIPAAYGIHGWVAVGSKINKDPYTVEDIDLIRTLTHQFAVVYERADAAISIHKSLYEMEVLNKIAVAINKNTDLDTLLLAVYSQMQSLFKIDKLSLVMESEVEGDYRRMFLVENGRQVISTHQPENLPENFLEKRSIAEGNSEIINEAATWLIVPLMGDNGGIIGSLSLGHSKNRNIFDQTNLNLINSIASLMSGAIIKTNLLNASQQQAEQLSMLNKVSQQLTSTLILEPLLKNILDGALEILNSSSGILMIIDEKRDELEFKVAAGPIGTPLIGKRLPADKGIAGEAYSNQTPVIKNNIDQDVLWFKDTHNDVISRIRNILAVPLITQGEVIGILEIINKNNNIPYDEEDLLILEGFASQAAIAIHNAKLYTETDRALEERIKELYLMQNIDRELNSTRDLSTALEITLKAALNHTNAQAGTIGMVDKESEHLEDLFTILPGKEYPIPLEKFPLKEFPWFAESLDKEHHIIHSKKLSDKLGISEDYQTHYLKQSELVEMNFVVLMLHLDSSESLNKEDVEFLNRLGDHAFLALKNTFLYQELQDSIQAKNEFISFISHELKNPLTVIKGYADILRKGMAGDVNEEQIDFLTTIAHNVKQMSTFITDLSDQSHIETRSLRLSFESTSVHEIVNDVLQSYENKINEKSLDFQVEIPKDIHNVWCDRLRLIQILSNLVSNAIKYTSESGRIEIGAEHAINTWDEEGAAEVVHFWVKDNGYGISKEDQKHLFEKFFRGNGKKIEKTSGSGLGLNISKTLTEMMGGKMWFESTEGEGSTFHFTMPI